MTYHMNQLSVNAMASSPNQGDEEGDLAVAPAKPKVKRPPLYKVVLLNDDYTPMEFVVEVLEHFFSMNREKATQVMLAVHTQGKGVCGITRVTWRKRRPNWLIKRHETTAIRSCARLNPRKTTKENKQC